MNKDCPVRAVLETHKLSFSNFLYKSEYLERQK